MRSVAMGHKRTHTPQQKGPLFDLDLLELDGEDLRPEPIEERKALLAKLLRGSHSSIAFNEHFEEDCEIVFREACKLGCEGIVSKRLGSPYRSAYIRPERGPLRGQ
jgi:ATP-dependent DNA ligase